MNIMRINIKTTPNNSPVSMDYQYLITGALHKWLGENEYHDNLSLYSFSGLSGGKMLNGKLDFTEGASFFISSWNTDLLKELISGMNKDPYMFSGMEIEQVWIAENPDLSNKDYFYLASPVYIQRIEENGNKKFFYYNDKESSALMVETLKTKMKDAGLPEDDSLSIAFDQSFNKKKIKMVTYMHRDKPFHMKVNWCPVIIKGRPETKIFAWNVGIGNSTGIGLGALK